MALYTDRAHWAFHTPKAKGPVDKTRLTQVGRALARLGIEHIPSYSPQARGRSERLNRTFQDRLSTSCASRDHDARGGQSVSRRPVRAAAQRHVRAAPRDPASAFVPLGAVDLERFSVTKRSARGRPRQHRDGRRAGVADRAAAGPPQLCRAEVTRRIAEHSIGGLTISSGTRQCGTADRRTAGGLWTLPQPWTPRTRPPLLGKRPERVSHSAHRRHSRKAVRSLVKRKRTDHLSTTGASMAVGST